MNLLVKKGKYGWSASCVNGGNNGEEKITAYIGVQFPKEKEPKNDCCQIKITEGFASCFKRKNGEILPKIVIRGYDIIKIFEDIQPKAEQTKIIEDDDLPF